MIRIVANIIGFNTGWLTAILGAASGRPWLAIVVVPPIVIFQALISRSPVAATWTIAAIALGGLIDAGLVLTGYLIPAPSWEGEPGWAIPWFFALWLNYAATVGVSFRWCRGRWILSAVLGGISGSTTYLAGERLGAIAFGAPHATVLTIIAIEWAIAFPASVWISERIERWLDPGAVEKGAA
jgi:hypothetical protein